MKQLLLPFFALLFTLTSYAGFHFPDEKFSYAKIYYFNLEENQSRPEDYIYSKEDGWAKTLVDKDITSSRSLTANIEKLFLYGKDGLTNGLSKCFIPRHGVVYFDEKDQPVASMSICFECGAIRMWTKSKGKIKANGSGSASRAGQQISTLKKFVAKEGVEIYDNPNEYLNLTPMKNEGSSLMEYYQLEQNIVKANYQEVKKWFTSSTPKEDLSVKYTGGGEKYEFPRLYLDDGTDFLFLDNSDDSFIGEATILSPSVVLPNGIQIGSSLEDVFNTLTIYDGPSYPAKLITKDQENYLTYFIEEGKVTKITINIYEE